MSLLFKVYGLCFQSILNWIAKMNFALQYGIELCPIDGYTISSLYWKLFLMYIKKYTSGGFSQFFLCFSVFPLFSQFFLCRGFVIGPTAFPRHYLLNKKKSYEKCRYLSLRCFLTCSVAKCCARDLLISNL